MLRPGLPSPDQAWSRRQGPPESPTALQKSVKREPTSERDRELVWGEQAGQQRRCHGCVTEQKQELVVRVVLVTVGGGIGATEKRQAVQECFYATPNILMLLASLPSRVRCGARGDGPRLRRGRAACCDPCTSQLDRAGGPGAGVVRGRDRAVGRGLGRALDGEARGAALVDQDGATRAAGNGLGQGERERGYSSGASRRAWTPGATEASRAVKEDN